ncbi:sporulation protein SpoOM [Paenibacillus sp. H1-7]|uniref:sporulation protein n=1 Tax=Paenibacillus sp. H1-7 TaxID=2282849 RepID=UPI001EF91D8B|nr:sporulation protein [Paenibacillus sp. H1-7]ULL13210.1 sporulation protein SpoOM [Paenibacillus sp. H1-7]
MSFFKKMLASVGIGSAKVDTQLHTERLAAGEEVQGVAVLAGGELEQQIDSLYLFVKTQYIKEENDRKVTKEAIIDKILISSAFTLGANERREIPFRFVLSEQTPITLRRTPVWIETGLDIKMAVDPTDRDLIEVLPHSHMGTVLDALEDLGFRLREITNDYSPRLGQGLPFVQEFEFVPNAGPFRGLLDELEVLFFLKGDDLELFLQIDRRARGLGGFFSEAMGADESFIRFTIPGDQLRRGSGYIADQLQELIRRYT